MALQLPWEHLESAVYILSTYTKATAAVDGKARAADDIMVSQAEEVADRSCSQPIKHWKLALSRQIHNNRSTRLKKLREKEREGESAHMNTQELLSVSEQLEIGNSSMLDSVKTAACGYYKRKFVLTMRNIY